MTNQCFKPFHRNVLVSVLTLTICFGLTALSYGTTFVSIQSDTLEVPKVGEHLTMDVNITGGKAVAGYQFTVAFDPTVFRYISAADAGYFPSGTYTVPLEGERDITLVAAALKGTATEPDGTLATLTFEVLKSDLFSSLHLTDVILADVDATAMKVRFSGEHDSSGTELTPLAPPEQTAVSPNYPNPFNPETWIPYQLAQPTEVTLTIFGSNGQLVRTLALGHKATGVYHSKSRAAYWNGKNDLGERVASGLYFYTLTAGDFTATGKMLILK